MAQRTKNLCMLHLSLKQIVVYHEDKLLYPRTRYIQEIHLKIIKSVGDFVV